MKVGIVGLPNVGKSTLFNCLSQSKAQSENYPFCTIDPNVSIVNVPDLRLDKLDELISPEKLIPTLIYNILNNFIILLFLYKVNTNQKLIKW